MTDPTASEGGGSNRREVCAVAVHVTRLMAARRSPLNVSSFMGLILLIGLIVKNGIILIDYADRLEDQGPGQCDALIRAGAIRLRPILMTTLRTLFRLLPLTLGLGSARSFKSCSRLQSSAACRSRRL